MFNLLKKLMARKKEKVHMIPLYDMGGNEPSGINTLEGWNARAAVSNWKAFTRAHGREPEDQEEVTRWVHGLVGR